MVLYDMNDNATIATAVVAACPDATVVPPPVAPVLESVIILGGGQGDVTDLPGTADQREP